MEIRSSNYKHIFTLTLPILAIIAYNQAVFAEEHLIKTGYFELTNTSGQLLDKETANNFAEIIDVDETITWRVYVPDTYNPNQPSGLMVYFDAHDQSPIPSEWKNLFMDKNLILASPVIDHRSFKAVEHGKWNIMGILSTVQIQQLYDIDTDRLYVSGHGIGCVTASQGAVQYSSIYQGGIFVSCGPYVWGRKPPAQVELMKNGKYYFLPSDEGFSKSHMRRVVKQYKKDGVDHAYLARDVNFDPDKKLASELLKDALSYLDSE